MRFIAENPVNVPRRHRLPVELRLSRSVTYNLGLPKFDPAAAGSAGLP
jgi:hypothetical protein